MKRRFNIYLNTTADDILMAILSWNLKRKTKTSQSKVIEDALIYYYDQKISVEIEKQATKLQK